MAQYDSSVNNFPYFSQNDDRWSDVRYGGGNIGSSGCGPTSAAMILKSYGFDVTPEDTASLFTKAMGGYQTTIGSTCFAQLENSPYNLTVTNTKNIDDVVSALKSNIPVVGNPHGPCDFTQNGHFIVLCGIDSDNRISVNDPNGSHFEMSKTKTWTPEYLKNCCVDNNCVDGFFVISNNGSGSIGGSGNSVHYTDFPKYSLSEDVIEDIATCITGETGGDDVLACRQEASQMANLNEVTYGRSNTSEAIYKTIHGGWYAKGSWGRGCTDTAIDAVKFVLVEGKRVLPRYVTEHDMFPLDAAISGHWYNGNSEDRSQYEAHSTKISQNPSRFNDPATYTFYCFLGSNKDGDVSGYFDKDYETYKDDIPWSEGATAGGSTTAEKEYHFADTNEKIPLHPTLFNQAELQASSGCICFFLNDKEIYHYVGEISWSNSKRTLATQMTFKTAKTDTDYIKQRLVQPAIGDIIRYYEDGTELFRGMIVTIDYGSRTYNSYTAVDAGWWLNKTTDTYQFTEADSLECINKILGDLSVPIEYLSDTLTAKISGVYVDRLISDLLLDIIDLNGGQYNFDFTPKGFRLYKLGEIEANPKFKYSPNTKEISSIEFRGEERHTGSIEDVKNSVKIISETDVLTKVQDVDSYNNYGFLQEVIQVDTETVTDVEQYAKDRLAAMTQASETLSFEIIEGLGSYTRAGEKLHMGEYDFIIESSEHTIENDVHHTTLDIWRWKKV